MMIVMVAATVAGGASCLRDQCLDSCYNKTEMTADESSWLHELCYDV